MSPPEPLPESLPGAAPTDSPRHARHPVDILLRLNHRESVLLGAACMLALAGGFWPLFGLLGPIFALAVLAAFGLCAVMFGYHLHADPPRSLPVQQEGESAAAWATRIFTATSTASIPITPAVCLDGPVRPPESVDGVPATRLIDSIAEPH